VLYKASERQELVSIVTATQNVLLTAEQGEWRRRIKGIQRRNCMCGARELNLWSTVFETGVRIMSPKCSMYEYRIICWEWLL